MRAQFRPFFLRARGCVSDSVSVNRFSQRSSFSPHVFYLAFVMIYVADNINININDIARVYLYLYGETHGIVVLMHIQLNTCTMQFSLYTYDADAQAQQRCSASA